MASGPAIRAGTPSSRHETAATIAFGEGDSFLGVDAADDVRYRRTMTMAEIRASLTLENTDDRAAVDTASRRTSAEGVVYTDAVGLVIPEEIATELGLRPWGTRTVVYADKRPEERPVTFVTAEIGDRATRTEAIVGPAGSQVLIGHGVLAMLDLVADSKSRTLVPGHPGGPVPAIR